jgi:hypothetical protein
MGTTREFRRLTFDRKLDVKRLQAALARAMRETATDPVPEAAPARLESVLIEPQGTTVYLSGNGPGLDAVAKAVRATVPGARIARAKRADAMRPPRDLRPRKPSK